MVVPMGVRTLLIAILVLMTRVASAQAISGVTNPVTLGWLPAVTGGLASGFKTNVDGTVTDVGLPPLDAMCGCPTQMVTLALGSHYASVTAYNTIGSGPRSNIVLFNVIADTTVPGKPTNFIIIQSVPPPPTPIWMSINLGNLFGTSSVSNAVWTLQSSGRTTWTAIDTCHYVYHLETGDATISVRVDNVVGGGVDARGGLMWRESLDVTATDVTLEVLATGQVEFRYRNNVAQVTKMGAPVATSSVPIYLRLTRVGSTIDAAYSLDNVTWVDFGPTEAEFPPTSVVGLDATGGVGVTVTMSMLAESTP
jgi:hypothetical protein